jgi:hypothetical protein
MILRLILGSAVILFGLNVEGLNNEALAQRINTPPPVVSGPTIHVAPPIAAPSVVVTPPPPPPKLDQPIVVRPVPVPCTDDRRRRREC